MLVSIKKQYHKLSKCLDTFIYIFSFLSICYPVQFSSVQSLSCVQLCDPMNRSTPGLPSPDSSKFSKPGFNNMWTVNFLMFKLILEKAEEPETKLPTSAGSWKKQESSRKTSISALLTMPKPLTVWTTINCGKFWKRWEYQTTWSASWAICM